MIILAFMVFLLMDARIESLWIIIPLAIVYLVLLVVESVRINSGFYLEALCRGNTKEKIVALTFDDGPDEIYTPRILEILEKHQIPACFFIIGKKAEERENILRLAISKGHIIGNHSYGHHFFFDFFGRKKMERDLLKTDEVIMALTGMKPVLFRPPYGVTNPVLARVVHKIGYKTTGWSIKSLDTVLTDEDKIIERTKDRLHPGAVILMHDNRAITAGVLEKIIVMIKKEGYRFVELKALIE